jgi:hypothetical protein
MSDTCNIPSVPSPYRHCSYQFYVQSNEATGFCILWSIYQNGNRLASGSERSWAEAVQVGSKRLIELAEERHGTMGFLPLMEDAS